MFQELLHIVRTECVLEHTSGFSSSYVRLTIFKRVMFKCVERKKKKQSQDGVPQNLMHSLLSR